MQHYRSVLIVDDSPTSRMIIQRCIEMTGVEVDSFLFAENGIEGLSCIEDNQVDLILTDINMPKMDGLTFIKLLKNKAATSNITIIVTSSIADGSIEAEMKKLGVMAVIKKPLSPEKIMRVLGGNE